MLFACLQHCLGALLFAFCWQMYCLSCSSEKCLHFRNIATSNSTACGYRAHIHRQICFARDEPLEPSSQCKNRHLLYSSVRKTYWRRGRGRFRNRKLFNNQQSPLSSLLGSMSTICWKHGIGSWTTSRAVTQSCNPLLPLHKNQRHCFSSALET